MVQAPSDAPPPDADIYTLGGGEDGPRVRAARSARGRRDLGSAGRRRGGRCWPCAPATRSWAALPRPTRAAPGVALLDVTTTKAPAPAPSARSWPTPKACPASAS